MISIVITTYGDPAWQELAWSRAYPSALGQAAHEIIVHHEPELSIGPARNAAAALAVGKWLCFLDADDELASDYLFQMRRALKTIGEEPLTLFQPAVRYVRKGRPAPDLLIPKKDLRRENFLVIGTLVSSALFHQVGGFGNFPHGFEDWSLWAKCWKAGAQIEQVPEAIYIAHVNPQSKHRVMWRNRPEQVAMHMRVQAELFPEGVP